ncbi:peptidase C14, caspase domain-containing protein [Armillaria novae-zelandiae]|uniref:Peptidase C14, caspase domain-containing protein n=1 Tax=Armillaria novae-zelandiae TaxID=153914 RepID=A0AA39PP37_9AGAR|nr:peptidase C14, caspase domain-containing protein [Armillaria novae-zelandiae]
MHFGFHHPRVSNGLVQSPFRPNPRPTETRPVARKALLIGISYNLEEYRLKSEDQVEGALTDVKQMYDILIGRLQFKNQDITVLTDEAGTPRHLWPTKARIERAIKAFVGGTSSGDICFLFYAGHGYQIHNSGRQEKDKRDNYIVPCDAVDPDGNFIEGKMIIDHLLKNILVMPLVAMDAKLTAIFDCCGTVLGIISPTIVVTTSQSGKGQPSVYTDTVLFSKTCANLSMIVPCTLNSFAPGVASNWDSRLKVCEGFCLPPKRRGSGYVVSISACHGEEFAWGGKKGGSFTRALIFALRHDPHPTLKDLNMSIGARVKVYSNVIENRKKKKQENPSKVAQHPQSLASGKLNGMPLSSYTRAQA